MTIKEEVLYGTEWDYSEIKEEVSDAIDLTLKKVEELIDEMEEIDLDIPSIARRKAIWKEELKQKLRGGE